MTKKYVNTKPELKTVMAGTEVAALPDGVKAMAPALCKKSWVSVWMGIIPSSIMKRRVELREA